MQFINLVRIREPLHDQVGNDPKYHDDFLWVKPQLWVILELKQAVVQIARQKESKCAVLAGLMRAHLICF